MRKSLMILILTTIGLFSCGQSGKSTPDKVTLDVEIVDSTKNKRQKPLAYDPNTFVDSEFKYTDSTGKDIVIQNSFPKGGGDIEGIRGYVDATGKHYGYGIFWTRVANKTTSPLELTINFPADSLTIPTDSFPVFPSYFKLFLPPDTMTLDKLSLYNYGITGLKPFLDTNFNKPPTLQRTINPNEECFFLVALLSHFPDHGPIRAGFHLKEQELFYRIDIDPFGSKEIPCGQIVFKKLKW